jgi:hypothetical protein
MKALELDTFRAAAVEVAREFPGSSVEFEGDAELALVCLFALPPAAVEEAEEEAGTEDFELLDLEEGEPYWVEVHVYEYGDPEEVGFSISSGYSSNRDCPGTCMAIGELLASKLKASYVE